MSAAHCVSGVNTWHTAGKLKDRAPRKFLVINIVLKVKETNILDFSFTEKANEENCQLQLSSTRGENVQFQL